MWALGVAVEVEVAAAAVALAVAVYEDSTRLGRGATVQSKVAQGRRTLLLHPRSIHPHHRHLVQIIHVTQINEVSFTHLCYNEVVIK